MARDLNSVIITGTITDKPIKNINGSVSFFVECRTLIAYKGRPQEIQSFVFWAFVMPDHSTIGRNIPEKGAEIRLIGHLEQVEGIEGPVIVAEIIERKGGRRK